MPAIGHQRRASGEVRGRWSVFIGPGVRTRQSAAALWVQLSGQGRRKSASRPLASQQLMRCKLSAWALSAIHRHTILVPSPQYFLLPSIFLALPLSSSVYSHAYPSPHHLRGDITSHGCGLVASGGPCAGSQPPSSKSGHTRSGGATGPQPRGPGLNIYVSAGGRWDGSSSHSSKDRSGGPRGRRSPGTAARARS